MNADQSAIADLRSTALMLETWGPESEPTRPNGLVTFSRALIDSAALAIRGFLARRKRALRKKGN